jgi:ribonuclease P protein component
LALRYLKNERRRDYRVAVIVSRKVSKSAVVRNRIRRRIYEIIRLTEPHFSGVYDLIVTVHNELPAKVAAADLEKVVKEAMTKAGVISDQHVIVNTSKPAQAA